jgi:hypothetical protein
MNLPETFVADGLKLAEGLLLFGKRLEEMSRDELIASAAQGWEAERRTQENSRRADQFSQELRQASMR